MKRRANIPGYPRNRGWTRLEVAIWLFALAFVITSGILLAAHVVGDWVPLVGSVIVMALGLMRYRAETAQKKRIAGDHQE
jgi:Flp pilus assembly protein TadB